MLQYKYWWKDASQFWMMFMMCYNIHKLLHFTPRADCTYIVGVLSALTSGFSCAQEWVSIPLPVSQVWGKLTKSKKASWWPHFYPAVIPLHPKENTCHYELITFQNYTRGQDIDLSQTHVHCAFYHATLSWTFCHATLSCNHATLSCCS